MTGSAEAEAIEIFAAQKKVQAMKKEVEQIIGFTYGQKGLDEYKATLRQVRAQRRKTEYRKAEIKEAIITWVVGGLISISAIAAMAVVFWFIGKEQGKW